MLRFPILDFFGVHVMFTIHHFLQWLFQHTSRKILIIILCKFFIEDDPAAKFMGSFRTNISIPKMVGFRIVIR